MPISPPLNAALKKLLSICCVLTLLFAPHNWAGRYNPGPGAHHNNGNGNGHGKGGSHSGNHGKNGHGNNGNSKGSHGRGHDQNDCKDDKPRCDKPNDNQCDDKPTDDPPCDDPPTDDPPCDDPPTDDPPCDDPPTDDPPCDDPPTDDPPCDDPPTDDPPCDDPPTDDPPCDDPPTDDPPCDDPPTDDPPCDDPPTDDPPCDDPPTDDPPCDDPPTDDPNCDDPPTDDPNCDDQQSQGDECVDDDKQSSYEANLSIAPVLFADGLKSRFITAAEAIPAAPLAQCQKTDCKSVVEKTPTQDNDVERLIYLVSSDKHDDYIVEDYTEGMIFIGAVASVSIVPGAALDGAGLGLVLLLEGDKQSHRRVTGLKYAHKVSALERPKKAHDFEHWNVGDKISYSLSVGGMVPIGAGVAVIGGGFAPVVDGRWRVTIEKTGASTAKFDFVKERELGIRAGIGTIFVNSTISSIGSKAQKRSFTVDFSTKQGQEQLEELLRYKTLFKGGMKSAKEATDEKSGQDGVIVTLTGKINTKTKDRKKIRVLIPFLLRWSLGDKTDTSKEVDLVFGDEGTCENVIFCQRKTDYRSLKAPNNFFKKQYRKNPHRARQRNGITQGMVFYKNSARSLSAEATLNISNNHLKEKHYKKAQELLNEYLPLGHSITQNIVWPTGQNYDGTLYASVSLSLEDQGIKNLVSARKNLANYHTNLKQTFEGSSEDYLSIIKSLDEFSSLVGDLDVELSQPYKTDNRAIARILRNIISKARKNHHVLQAINLVAPGALKAKMQLSGTNIKPMTQEVGLN